jgi:predicted MFS family arabinose efflux permease
LTTSAQTAPPDRRLLIGALGIAQILAFGTSFYFPAVFAPPILAETGWSLGLIVGGTSIGLLAAGLVSPQVGHLIDRHGGRPVLSASSVLFAIGLTGVGLAPSVPVYLASWVVIGLGMGTGLYDAAFAALGRIYGREARSSIANLTLFGGFSSTICWPLSAFMIDRMGWREACLAYAVLHLVLALPLQLLVLPKAGTKVTPPTDGTAADPRSAARIVNEAAIFSLLALVLSLAAGIGSIVIVHLVILLQAHGVDAPAAVALGALFGPAQVSARIVERLFGGRYHPIWTMIAACALMAAGLAMLGAHTAVLPLVVLVYGAGYGISWIGRGTLPLALFGPERFPRLMGRLAFPSLIVQALAPSAGAFMIEATGTGPTLLVLIVLAVVNLLLIGAVWVLSRAPAR